MVGARFPSIDPMTTGAGDHDEAGQGHSPAAMPTVVSIHLAPASRLPTRAVDRVVAETGAGLVGDRYHGTRHRHVSVQSLDGLRAAAVDFGAEIDPGLTRRNITISHGVVPTAPGARLSIGDVRLEAVRVAAPCRLLDDTIGNGARHHLNRGRSGTIFRVLAGGTICVGDPVDIDPAVDQS